MVPFTPQRVTRTASILLSGSPSQVFPLFEPLGEKQWSPDWEPTMIYPESGITEEGAVFTTQHSQDAPKIWTVALFEPQCYRIAYQCVAPDSHIAKIVIRCADTLHGATSAEISYTFTALTELGNSYVGQFTDDYYRAWIGSWESAINHYLQSGQPLHHHELA